LTETSVWGAWL
jgi:hypothetical protein